jgi:hypothetical protein
MSLYRAYSLEHFRGSQVGFVWYVPAREKPAAPHDQLIAGYADLQGEELAQAKQAADELLTEAELEGLRAYLHLAHDVIRFYAEEQTLPMAPGFGLGAVRISETAYLYMLSEEAGYSLSIPVYGRYRADLPRPSMAEVQELLAGSDTLEDLLAGQPQDPEASL